ncbi:histidine kinase-like ATPase [Thermothelomyces heterothallicus CBS 202.75]|uniref:histidine kinase-like ATPase n=1 Tax=Thermothelomyces heterothallicus CBS 202.75 TaxID=1149848 RepID=UPI003743064B
MPILPLTQSTARRLGSTLAITSPVLLLKELLDNAIDADATSMDVLVAPNTVDRIEVRDNGHGISPEDFDGLGRPGHTSKLRFLEELDTLGGRTLGFRGVALASINALAEVSITTRVATEHVATVISLAKGGGVATRRHAASPVGTVVRVTSLFSNLPVRQRAALKDAQKSLDRMRDLLRAYALTRPSIRLRFTVLQNPGLSWSYAPAVNGGVKEAALQLFGMDLASQCTFLTFPGEHSERDDGYSNFQDDTECSSRQEGGAIFEALLPGATADPLKVSKGAFVSVDGRPISTALGTAKKLVYVFRRCIEDHFATTASRNPPRDPFITLNIRCPPGAYDVNIEPSKEDVIFKEEDRILGQLESFLSRIYPPSAPHGSKQSARADVRPSANAGAERSSEGSLRSLAPQVR